MGTLVTWGLCVDMAPHTQPVLTPFWYNKQCRTEVKFLSNSYKCLLTAWRFLALRREMGTRHLSVNICGPQVSYISTLNSNIFAKRKVRKELHMWGEREEEGEQDGERCNQRTKYNCTKIFKKHKKIYFLQIQSSESCLRIYCSGNGRGFWLTTQMNAS